MPTYPTNANDPTLVINNITDYRELVDKVSGNGDILLTNPTQTLIDFVNPSNGAGILTNMVNECNTFISTMQLPFSTLDQSFFAKHKEWKILMLTHRALRFAFEIHRLNADLVLLQTNDVTTLPNVPSLKYPSNSNDF